MIARAEGGGKGEATAGAGPSGALRTRQASLSKRNAVWTTGEAPADETSDDREARGSGRVLPRGAVGILLLATCTLDAAIASPLLARALDEQLDVPRAHPEA